ncbi:tetratricopeptide repeat protein [Massilia sp. W12]|uniref:tetratricopeptide repeat protein n=1 Tax=Massilia sp. W12 TaxID=3126507 RepID=UPI0030D25ED6
MKKKRKAMMSQEYEKALKIMQMPNPNIEEAKNFLFRALEKCDPYAAYALGTWYFHGSYGIQQNKEKGVELWLIASEKKVTDALFDLAVSYETGNGVKKNLSRAAMFYIDAAIRGDRKAIFEVGRCYFFGIGLAKNKKIADIWFERAEEFGMYENNRYE